MAILISFTVPLAFNSINLFPVRIPERHFSIMGNDIPIFLFAQPIDTFVSSVALYVFNLKTGLVSRSPRSTINHPVDDRALPIVYSERHRAAVLMTSPNQGKKCIFIHSGLDVQRSPRLHCFIMAVLWRSTLASEQVPSWFYCYYQEYDSLECYMQTFRNDDRYVALWMHDGPHSHSLFIHTCQGPLVFDVCTKVTNQ